MIKNPPANARDVSSIPGSGRPLREGGYSLQYSCLGNPMDRGACMTTKQQQNVDTSSLIVKKKSLSHFCGYNNQFLEWEKKKSARDRLGRN